MAAQCAERLIGCSLELGGKNPMLVLRDASVEKAAEGAVRAVFSNAGQLCVSMERLYVADRVYDRFVDRFVARTRAMSPGASLEWTVDMGSLISRDQLDTVRAHVDDAVAKGARVLAGGKARPDLGPFYFEPTIPEGVTPDMTCFGHETFRSRRVALPLPRRGRRGRPRQRGQLRPQRRDLHPGWQPRP
ncbi:aldehyde dehydrogenase family protein [Nocardioides sp. B-3]|uniref:aldehyde dehydrogenase family protein n=1 Tax=Nocardioides sp. B-3 TaxID=2895565 RepID=UPI00300E64A1